MATVMLLKVCVVALPLMLWAAEVLLKFTRPVLGVNVPPLLAQLPLTLIVAAVPAANVPAVNVTLFTVNEVVLPPTVRVPPLLLTTKLLKVSLVAVPLIACAPLPLKVSVPVPPLNFPPFLVKSPVI